MEEKRIINVSRMWIIIFCITFISIVVLSNNPYLNVAVFAIGSVGFVTMCLTIVNVFEKNHIELKRLVK